MHVHLLLAVFFQLHLEQAGREEGQWRWGTVPAGEALH